MSKIPTLKKGRGPGDLRLHLQIMFPRDNIT